MIDNNENQNFNKENGREDFNESYSYSPADNNTYGYTPAPKTTPPKKEKGFGIGAIILSVVLSVIISSVASVYVATGALKGEIDAAANQSDDKTSSEQDQTASSLDQTQGNSSTVISTEGNIESLVEAVYQKSANSVVGIRATVSVQGIFGSNENTGEGSGVIYSTDGYIITNYHVIQNVIEYQSANKIIEVYLPSNPEKAIDASVVGYNVSADLAVIKIDKKNLPAIDIGNANDIKVGQYAIAIGCPGGLEFMGSVSYGIVSGLNRSITIDSIGEMKLIQTDAAISPGNSGGALLNSKGQLIGINSSKLVQEGFEGMGFAIPIDTVVEVVKDIIDNKDNPSPYIGIEIYTYSGAYLEKYNLPHGAAVKSVVSGAPAANAKIKAGDIITEFNSVVIDEYTDFIEELNKCTPGTKVNAKIYRNGRYYTTTVTIGSNNSR